MELGRLVGGDQIAFEQFLPATPAEVWPYLTRSDLMSGWLGEGTIAAEPGGEVLLTTGFGGPVIRGTVTAHEPERRLSYTWNVMLVGLPKPIGPESTVVFTLAPHEGGTRLTMTQGPIVEGLRAPSASGWHALLELLYARIAGEEADFMEVVARVQPAYEKMTGGT